MPYTNRPAPACPEIHAPPNERAVSRRRRTSVRAQSLVEFALVLPVLALLLVMAIDFGRLFFGSVSITNAARVGANYAAMNPDAPNWDRYRELIDREGAPLGCVSQPHAAPTFTTSGGASTAHPELGDYASATVKCDFTLITPLAGAVIGRNPITLTATTAFPVRYGCANCPESSPAPPPDAPPQCRTTPGMNGLSVAGARNAWIAAGFIEGNFDAAGAADTETVASASITDAPDSTCLSPAATFSARVLVMTEPAEATDASCRTVPNLIGMVVADARQAWTDAQMTGAFEPPDQDDRVVTDQQTDPASTPGVTCLDPVASVQVTTGDPLPDPPPAPCRVPDLIGQPRGEAQRIWGEHGFTTQVAFEGPSNNFKIQSQSLVGGDWVSCDSSITVSNKA